MTSKDVPEVRFDREKFLAAVHYIIEAKSSDPDSLGLTKLHKSLYYSDMLSFVARRVPITGVEYVKAPRGPMARYLNWALKELGEAGKITYERRDYYGLQKYDFFSIQPSQTNLLDSYERELLGVVIEFVSGFSAKEISEISHDKPWQNVKMGDRIPYASAYLLLPRDTPTLSEVEWARAEIRKRAP